MRLKDKVAIITGAAQGMGAAHARRFVAEGARVVLTDINADAGGRLAKELGSSALFLAHDVASETACQEIDEALMIHSSLFVARSLFDARLRTSYRTIGRRCACTGAHFDQDWRATFPLRHSRGAAPKCWRKQRVK